jgi:hypothetical protein
LSASSAPIRQPIKGVVGYENAHVYQIQRTEDRRLRYRLRLGPFVTEEEAEAILTKVRDIYPCALTATAEADDLRAIASVQAKLDARQPVDKVLASRGHCLGCGQGREHGEHRPFAACDQDCRGGPAGV